MLVRLSPDVHLSAASAQLWVWKSKSGQAVQMCKLSRCALTLCLQMCTHGNHLVLQLCLSILVPPAVCPAVTSGTSPAAGLNAAASPRPPNPPRCEHPGNPCCPRFMWKRLPPPQMCPKSPLDVNTLWDPDVQTYVGTFHLLLCTQM